MPADKPTLVNMAPPRGKLKCFVGVLDDRRQGLVLVRSQNEGTEIVGCKEWRFKKYWYVMAKHEWPIADPKPGVLYSRDWSRTSNAWSEET